MFAYLNLINAALLKDICTYCNTLHKAFGDANYCSKQGDSLSQVKSNAYYFKSNDLESGSHISRLSIRTITRGYQRHEINGSEYLLDSNKYLLVPEGFSFQSEVKTSLPIEGLLVAFHSADVAAITFWANSNESYLLDNPFSSHYSDISLSPLTLTLSTEVNNKMSNIKKAMQANLSMPLFYETQFLGLLHSITYDINSEIYKIDRLTAQKLSTKKEIYTRVSRAKEYIDCHLDEKLNLNVLSQISTMSPYHFLRSFSDLYKQSPHQYIISKRIEKSKFLLEDTSDPLDEIIQKIGFQNKSSFTRLFKKETGMTTSAFRSLSQV